MSSENHKNIPNTMLEIIIVALNAISIQTTMVMMMKKKVSKYELIMERGAQA